MGRPSRLQIGEAADYIRMDAERHLDEFLTHFRYWVGQMPNVGFLRQEANQLLEDAENVRRRYMAAMTVLPPRPKKKESPTPYVSKKKQSQSAAEQGGTPVVGEGAFRFGKYPPLHGEAICPVGTAPPPESSPPEELAPDGKPYSAFYYSELERKRDELAEEQRPVEGSADGGPHQAGDGEAP